MLEEHSSASNEIRYASHLCFTDVDVWLWRIFINLEDQYRFTLYHFEKEQLVPSTLANTFSTLVNAFSTLVNTFSTLVESFSALVIEDIMMFLI